MGYKKSLEFTAYSFCRSPCSSRMLRISLIFAAREAMAFFTASVQAVPPPVTEAIVFETVPPELSVIALISLVISGIRITSRELTDLLPL